MEFTTLGRTGLRVSVAGLGCGLYGSLDEIAARWAEDRSFTPTLAEAARDDAYERWQAAVARVRSS